MCDAELSRGGATPWRLCQCLFPLTGLSGGARELHSRISRLFWAIATFEALLSQARLVAGLPRASAH